MSKELDELYLKLRKKQSDLIHCRYRYIADKLEFDIRTIEIDIDKQKRKEGQESNINDKTTPF